jgi:outer membrane protein assembly factor BamB
MRGLGTFTRFGLLVLALLVGSVSLLVQPRPYQLAPRLAASPGAWPTYHMDNTRSGNDVNEPTFGTVTNLWTSAQLDGMIYAEPLVVGTTVYVATEGNSVYALNASSGAVIWKANIGAPLPSTAFGCGNINPVGITGTPVIDTANNILYAVGVLAPVHDVMVAVNLSSGAILWQRSIDPATMDATVQGTRGALALSGGYVYVPFGGRFGDCGNYNGWVVGVPANGTGTILSAKLTGQGGGIWAPSGAAVDAATGDLFVATGNTFSTSTFDYGESVLKLSPTLSRLDYFAPTDWAALNASDTDLGSIGPAILANGWIFQTGKAGEGYMLKQGALGGIGGQAFSAHVCPGQTVDATFGGTAYAAPYLYVPCTNGLEALITTTPATGSTPTFAPVWQGASGEAPIVAGGVVWTIDRAGTLLGLDPTTGATRYNLPLISATAHFATPSAGGGKIFVGAGTHVQAFGSPTATVTNGASYKPVTPARILDTRTGSPVGAGQSIDVQVTGVGGVPATGVAAAILNVTVTQPTASGYLTVYPTGGGRPLASSLNFVAGQTVPNLVEVALGTGGKVSAYNFSGSTHVVMDVAGWVATPPPGPDGLFNSLAPARILDTRSGTGGVTIGPNTSIDVQVTGQGLVPATGVAAVVLNVTATNPTASSYLTVFPTGAVRPTASNLNFLAGQTVPNRVVVKVGTAGKVTIYNLTGNTDVVADVGGWFTDATSTAGGSVFYGITPARILDTRNGGAPIGANGTLTVPVGGAGVVPATAKAVVMNVTVTNTTLSSYLTVWPDLVTRPTASDLNWAAGQTVPNLVIVQLGTNGSIDLYNLQGNTDVVLDVVGWYA